MLSEIKQAFEYLDEFGTEVVISNKDFKWLVEQAEILERIENVMGLSHADSFNSDEAIFEIESILKYY